MSMAKILKCKTKGWKYKSNTLIPLLFYQCYPYMLQMQCMLSQYITILYAIPSILKGYPKKTPFWKFDMWFSCEPLVPGGCPSQDLVYSWVDQVLRRTTPWDQRFKRKLHIKFWKRRFFLDNPLYTEAMFELIFYIQ